MSAFPSTRAAHRPPTGPRPHRRPAPARRHARRRAGGGGRARSRSPTRSSSRRGLAFSKFGSPLPDRLRPGTRSRDSLRRARLHLRHRVTSFIALLIATPLAIAIALFLSELAPRGVRGVDRHARRAARRDPERRARPLGDPRPRAVRRPTTSSRCCSRWLGFLPFFSGNAELDRLPHRRPDPRDHDPPDHRQHLPRALPRACRASSRRARSRSARRAGR